MATLHRMTISDDDHKSNTRVNRPQIRLPVDGGIVTVSEDDMIVIERRIVELIGDGELRGLVGSAVERGDVMRCTFDFCVNKED